MNQKTQKGIVTTGSEKKQLATKLTYMQQMELDQINEYRAEVGAAPLEYDASFLPWPATGPISMPWRIGTPTTGSRPMKTRTRSTG